MAIPKVIHYCWFGGKPLDPLGELCMTSWEKHYPDYKIMRWDEETFDVNKIPFTKEAYQHKKWAFVSDYVRLYALFKIGGIYMDTDYETIKPLSQELLMNEALIGYENDRWFSTAFMASQANNRWIELLLSYYQNRHFIEKDGSMHVKPNPIIITELSKSQCNFKIGDSYINYGNVKVMPTVSFSPYKRKESVDHSAYLIDKDETYGIHHLAASWADKNSLSRKAQRFLRPILSKRAYAFIVDIYNKVTFKN